MEHVFTRMFCYSCEGAVSCENGASGLSGSDLFFCFCFLFFNSNGRTAQGTVNEVNAIYGEDAPHMTVKYWHSQFKWVGDLWKRILSQCDPSLPLMRRLSNRVCCLEDRRIVVRQRAKHVKVSVGSVDKIIHGHLHTGGNLDPSLWSRHQCPIKEMEALWLTKKARVIPYSHMGPAWNCVDDIQVKGTKFTGDYCISLL